MLTKNGVVRGTLVAGMLLVGASVHAEFYTGAQVSMLKIDRGNVSDVALTDLNVRGGLVLHELLSAEVHAGKGFGDDSYQGVEVENDFHYGVYARLTPPVAGPIRPYLLGGYGYVENDFNGETLRDDGTSFGGGFDLGLEEHMSMSLEYLRLVDNEFGKQELIGLGLNYRF
ncbi:MAG: outer membrane beta-barrel protein [Pseudomonadota bacterium]|nr:outer membrane beta-barrel protein [Pseudomonadota bacterium]